jgi:hypothetical protein
MHLLPVSGFDGCFGWELQRRIGMVVGKSGVQSAELLSEGTRAMLLERAARGNLLARPVSSRWRDSYGRFLAKCSAAVYWRDTHGRVSVPYPAGQGAATYRGGSAAGSRLIKAVSTLESIPPFIRDIRTRPLWPAGVHPSFDVSADEWWPIQQMAALDIRWTASPGGESGTYTGTGVLTLPISTQGDVEVTFELGVLRIPMGQAFEKLEPVHRERRKVSYRTCGDLQEVTGILRSEALDRVVESAVHFYARAETCDIDATGLAAHSGGELGDLSSVGFGGVAEVIVDDEVLTSFRVRWKGDQRWFRVATPEVMLSGDQQRKLVAAAIDGTGKVRLTSDAELGLAVLDADRIWIGRAEIPLRPPSAPPGLRSPARQPPR